jgi:hypothetical protein
VKYILGSFFIVSIEISSSAFEGALYLLHIEQRALQRYVTITVPFNFFSDIINTLLQKDSSPAYRLKQGESLVLNARLQITLQSANPKEYSLQN